MSLGDREPGMSFEGSRIRALKASKGSPVRARIGAGAVPLEEKR
jgi:hypothetical protein